MTEQSTPDLSQMSPVDIVDYLKARYLKPRWPHWQNMGEVLLYEAVWLSFNVEPFGDEIDAHKAAEGISRRLPHVMQRYSVYLIDSLREDYDQRMKQCIANLWTKKLPSQVSLSLVGELKRCPVSLDRFRRWGESLPAPYTFPDEFPPGTPLAVGPTEARKSEPAVASANGGAPKTHVAEEAAADRDAPSWSPDPPLVIIQQAYDAVLSETGKAPSQRVVAEKSGYARVTVRSRWSLLKRVDKPK